MWKIDAQPNLTVYCSRGGTICIQEGEPADFSKGKFSVVGIQPKALAEVIERMRAAAESLQEPDVSGIKLRLPSDLKAALHESRPLRVKVEAADDVYGTDTITLKPLRALKVEILKTRPQFGSFVEQDPHRSEAGYYAVPVVHLVQGAAADSFLWLPNERRYGTYDREHTTIMMFRPKLTWTKFRGDIERYFAATNMGGGVENPELAEYFCPWPSVPFVAQTPN